MFKNRFAFLYNIISFSSFVRKFRAFRKLIELVIASGKTNESLMLHPFLNSLPFDNEIAESRRRLISIKAPGYKRLLLRIILFYHLQKPVYRLGNTPGIAISLMKIHFRNPGVLQIKISIMVNGVAYSSYSHRNFSVVTNDFLTKTKRILSNKGIDVTH
jgi:hypothetical protein